MSYEVSSKVFSLRQLGYFMALFAVLGLVGYLNQGNFRFYPLQTKAFSSFPHKKKVIRSDSVDSVKFCIDAMPVQVERISTRQSQISKRYKELNHKRSIKICVSQSPKSVYESLDNYSNINSLFLASSIQL